MFTFLKRQNEDKIRQQNGKEPNIPPGIKTALSFVSFVTLGLLNSCTVENAPTTGQGSAPKASDGTGNPVATATPTPTTTPTPTATATPTPTPTTPAVKYGIAMADVSYQLGGTVVDNTSNQPIAGAMVTFLTATVQTDAKGVWTLNLMSGDCATSSGCLITVTPPTSAATTYQQNSQQLVDTDTTAQKFVSLGNVTKLSTAPSTAIAVYAVALYAVTPVTK